MKNIDSGKKTDIVGKNMEIVEKNIDSGKKCIDSGEKRRYSGKIYIQIGKHNVVKPVTESSIQLVEKRQ